MPDSVTLVLDGSPFEFWTEFSASRKFDEATGEAQFTLTETLADPFPVYKGAQAQCIIHGTPFVTGFVHTLESTDDWETHDITITIRDKTQDLIDSTLGPDAKFKPPVDLTKLSEETLKFMGLSSIKVKSYVQLEPFKEGEVPVSDVGEEGFSFLERWAQKRQVLINTDGEGNLVITRNLMKRGPGSIYRSRNKDDPRNNILGAKYSVTDKDQHNSVAAAGQKSPGDKEFWEGLSKGDPKGAAQAMSTGWGMANDTSVRPERRHFLRSDRSMQGKTPEDTAKWFTNVRRASGFQYSARVAGWRVNETSGPIWQPGVLIPVRDDFYGVAGDLLLDNVSFGLDWDGGEVSELSFTVKDAYTMDAAAGADSQRAGGGGFGQALTGQFGAAFSAISEFLKL